MEPVSTFHDSVKVEVRRISLSDCRMSAVINHLARTHGCSRFKIIDSHTVAATSDVIGFHAILAQCVHCALPDFVFRQLSYEISVVSIVGTAHSYVCFTSTVNYVKAV